MMKVGYIQQYNLKMHPHLDKPFKFYEESYQRRITSRGDRVYSKMFLHPIDYDEIESDTEMVKKNQKMMLVKTPLILDEDLRNRMINWVDWANEVGPKGYDPFYAEENE